MNRRSFLAAAASAAVPAPAAEIRREVFVQSPGKGTAVMAYAFYTRKKGGSMISVDTRWSRSDTIDIAYIRRSEDNGRTWSAPVASPTGEKRPNGMLRRHTRAGFVDPNNGRYLEFWLEAVLPGDDPLEGMRLWKLFYRVWRDGKNFGPPQQVIHEGREFNSDHPFPGVRIGANCVMLGDQTSKPVAARDGAILLPIQLSLIGPDGKPFNPGGGYTYTNAALLRGRWKGSRLEWRMSEEIKLDTAQSTRGAVEPTVETLDDGRLLMVIRGSNDRKTEIPSYRWISYSNDGWHWSAPRPWTWHDGTRFFSPSSCSELLRHSNGKLYWLGNITPTNPRGNRPRFPMVIAEVDRKSGLLDRATLRTVDDRQPGEHEILSLSNFYAREDRETREIALHMTRLFAHNDGWEGDAMLYRIPC